MGGPQVMKRRHLNQKGIASLLIALIAIPVCIAILFFFDMSRQVFIVNEIQGVADNVAINTLRQNVDYDYLKDEILAIDKNNKIDSRKSSSTNLGQNVRNKLLTAYKKKLAAEATTNTHIKSVTVRDTNFKVWFEQNSWGTKQGESHEYLVLESVIEVQFKFSGTFDFTEAKQTINNVKTGGTSTITLSPPADGYTKALIHTVSRIVYR